MKRNIVIAVVTAAALVGGGTATALAVSGDDDAPATKTQAQTQTQNLAQAQQEADDDDTDRDDRDDRDEPNDDRDDRDDRKDRDDRDEPNDDRDEANDDRDESGAAGSGNVTAAEAIAAALKHTPGTAVSAELDDHGDDDGGRAVWEVDVLDKGDTWYSVRIDPSSGNVLGSHRDDEDDAAEVRAALKGASVTAEEAAKAASAKGTVTSVELDDDNDKGWEIETNGSAEWKVGLNSTDVTPDQDDSSDDD
ncbi:PepSY domain-containing protein [Streptomyces thermocarboxydovorans]|uniref:PepSY domain-containing protein n=1 Tax=Streptomyces thermocarboxydovorans TaxID=59298 RepID=A0ABN1HGP5_9ACTN